MIFVTIQKLRGDSDLIRKDYVVCTLLERKESKTSREGEEKETGYGGGSHYVWAVSSGQGQI